MYLQKRAKFSPMTTAIYSHPDCKLHESPARLLAIEDQLIASQIAPWLDYREAPAATEQQLARAHSADAIYRIRENCPAANAERPYFPLDADTSLNPFSLRAALRAAGAAVAATDAVIVRPVITPRTKKRWASAYLIMSRWQLNMPWKCVD
jgi:acetoin utilization deacetylase AcuC-like enzyme